MSFAQIILRFFFSFLISSQVFLVVIFKQIFIWFAIIFLFMISGTNISQFSNIRRFFALDDITSIWKGSLPQILRKAVWFLPQEIPKSWQERKRKVSKWIATKNIHFAETLPEFICKNWETKTKCFLYVSVLI